MSKRVLLVRRFVVEPDHRGSDVLELNHGESYCVVAICLQIGTCWNVVVEQEQGLEVK